MLLKMEKLHILIVVALFLASTDLVASAESLSSSSASSSAQSSSTSDSSSASGYAYSDAYSDAYSESDYYDEKSQSFSSSSASSSAQSASTSDSSSASAYAYSDAYSDAYSESDYYDKNPPICNENEVFDECPAPCPPKRCDVDERIIRCKAPPNIGDPECKPGCRCIDNYYRNDNNVCVPKNKCPVKCRDNEIFDVCPPKCPPQKCGVDPAVILCSPNPELGDPECEPSCRCIDGYYRNDFGDCIPKHQCPPKLVCGPNEQYSSCVNGGCARRSCSQNGILCIDPIICKEGCRCKDKYLRADNGTCIPEDQCPLKCYGQNEVPGYENNCPPQTCESIGKRYNCPLKPVNPPCKSVCRCKPGYYRNKIGQCISKNDCLKCTGPHEYFSCGSACDNECYNLSQQNQTNCPIINIKCNEKCYCEDGYARNSKNICIPYAKCPLKCYGQNEVPGCDDSCPPQTCESIGKHYFCPRTPVNKLCRPVCRCKPGYFRNKIGDCISKNNCLKCTGPHEYFSCGADCDNECYNLSQQNQTNCPIINIKCNEKCYCEHGYARNSRNICVPYEKCPPETKPKPDVCT